MGGDRQDRSQGLKYPLKDPRSRRVTSHDRETHEKVGRAAGFGLGTAARPADHKCNIICRTVNMPFKQIDTTIVNVSNKTLKVLLNSCLFMILDPAQNFIFPFIFFLQRNNMCLFKRVSGSRTNDNIPYNGAERTSALSQHERKDDLSRECKSNFQEF